MPRQRWWCAVLAALEVLLVVVSAGRAAELAELEARLPATRGRERVDLLNEISKAQWGVSTAATIAYGEQARDLARELAYPAGEAAGLRNIGIGHWYADDHGRALDFSLQALAIYERIGDDAGIAGTRSTIGTIYLNLERLAEARTTYLEALAIAERIGDRNRIGIVLSNLGTVAIGQADYRAALGYFERALPVLEGEGSQLSVLTCLANIAGVHRRLGEQERAREINLRVLELATRLDAKARMADALSDLGEIEAALGRPDQGRRYLSQAIELAAREGLKRTEQSAEEAWSRVDEEAGDYRAALVHHRRYAELRDQIFSEESKQAVADLEVRYETGKKEQEIAIQRLEIEKQTGARNALLGIAALVLVVAGVNHSRYRAKRKAADALAALAEVNDRLAKMQGGSTLALADAGAWAERTAVEVARTIDAQAIAVYALDEGGQLVAVGAPTLPPPALAEVERAGHEPVVFGGSPTVVPLFGMAGKVVGALVVDGKQTWNGAEERLVSGFANQLGSTLELRRLREELDASTVRRAAVRGELLARGDGVLHVCPQCRRCFDETMRRCPSDGAVPVEDSRLLPFRLLSRYALTQVLGEGGMGIVFAARDQRLVHEVAIKVIRPEQAHSTSARIRFEQEARVLAQVSHPNVIAIHDSGELDDGSLYLIMERLHGRTCRQLLADLGRLPVELAAVVLRQGAAALDACHALGLVHRDVKPENLFVVEASGGAELRLLDFGLAREIGDLAHLTATGAVIGTPGYMSPEQLQGRPLDMASDVYSFAAVGFELLTGQRWLAGRDLGEILVAMHAPVRPRLERALGAGAPPAVVDAFVVALSPPPEMRPTRLTDWVDGFVAVLPEATGWALPSPSEVALPPTHHGG